MNMKKLHKQTLQSQRNFFSAFYGDGFCECSVEERGSLEEIEMAIEECKMMLQESIDRNDKDEIFYWRKMLQENKVNRRELLNI